tara:strand:- start:59 stop:355 length:297 start_codon:yes stop_codon:yes gene_type:complete
MPTKKPTTEAEPVTTPVRRSSAYTRVVANTRLEVINVKQNPNDAPSRAKKKWAIIACNGNRTTLIGQSDKKYPAIDILLATEKKLKAAEADKAAKADK